MQGIRKVRGRILSLEADVVIYFVSYWEIIERIVFLDNVPRVNFRS